jgi:hypothetical protein
LVVRAPEGERLSQFVPPLCTEALAVKLVALPAVTERICDAGAALFNVPKKFSEVGLRVTPVEPCATVSLTPTVVSLRDVRREIFAS